MTARSSSPEFPHRAYIEALADAPEGGASWHLIIAGYATIQLFERWADLEMGAVPPSTIELRRVRKYIDAATGSHPICSCLSQLVDGIESVSTESPTLHSARGREIGELLATYAKLLQYDGQWGLASDVHKTIIGSAHLVADTERLLDSMLMRGFSLRMQGMLDEASVAYAGLRSAAVLANNERYRLESFLSEAKLAVDRGNIPVARELLDRTIDEARRAECSIVISKGLTDRARVAAMQGEFELSLTCSYEALERSVDQMDRERILGNIAATFAQMGLRDAARDAALLVVATAQERNTRLTALVNLMELAYQEGRELVFEQYRRELAREELTPYLLAVSLETSAAGLRTFGRYGEALAATQRLLDVAEQHGLHEFVIKAEAALSDHAAAPARVAAPTGRSAEPSHRVASIVRAIADMRQAAGLS